MTKRTKILYLCGLGRSGGTLLGRMLGEAPSAICIGELQLIWVRGVRENVDCGCGAPFKSCPFWSAVGNEAFGGWSNVTMDVASQIDRSLTWPHTLRIQGGSFGNSAMGDSPRSRMIALYQAIARVSGATTLIDLSRTYSLAKLLTRSTQVDLRLVHLIRDSRAVAYSMKRWKPVSRRPRAESSAPQFMGRARSTGLVAARWLRENLTFHLLAAGNPYLRLRYEDLIADPHDALQAIGRLADHDLDMPSSRLNGDRIYLGAHHIFSGNPMREDIGWMRFALDDEWRTMMPASQRSKMTALTWPLLHFYGYM